MTTRNKPQMKIERVELDPKTKAQLMDEKNKKQDEAMMRALGINVPREEVLMMRGINDPRVYAFFDIRHMSLIRWADQGAVEEAVKKAAQETKHE